LHLILFLVGVSFFFSLLALGDVMSCVFEKELEWTRWNPTGRCRKEEKKEKEIVSWMEIFPTFIVRCYRQSSRANPLEYYFIFLSVCGGEYNNNNNNINTFFFLFSWFTKMGSGDALILYCLILTCAIPPPLILVVAPPWLETIASQQQQQQQHKRDLLDFAFFLFFIIMTIR
jgi:hypothetical protein